MSLNETKLFRLEDELAEMKKRVSALETRLMIAEAKLGTMAIIPSAPNRWYYWDWTRGWLYWFDGPEPAPWPSEQWVTHSWNQETPAAISAPSLAQETQQPGRQLSFSSGEQPSGEQPG